jgi:hypothetical protein
MAPSALDGMRFVGIRDTTRHTIILLVFPCYAMRQHLTTKNPQSIARCGFVLLLDTG